MCCRTSVRTQRHHVLPRVQEVFEWEMSLSKRGSAVYFQPVNWARLLLASLWLSMPLELVQMQRIVHVLCFMWMSMRFYWILWNRRNYMEPMSPNTTTYKTPTTPIYPKPLAYTTPFTTSAATTTPTYPNSLVQTTQLRTQHPS